MEKLRAYCLKHHRLLLWLAFPLLSLAMHAWLLDLPLQGIHAWRQCETASNVVNFATVDNDLFNPRVFNLFWADGLKRMEFPIMQWLFAQVVRIFGDHVVILRIMSWLIGWITVLGFFKLIDLLMRDKFLALAGAWCWMFSPVLFYYSINPLPDNFSLMAAVWGLAGCMAWFRGRSWTYLLLGFAGISLATATKLPFVVFITVPYGMLLGKLVRERLNGVLSFLSLSAAGAVTLAPALAWYLWVIPQWTGNGVVKGILDSTAEDVPLILKSIGKNLLMILPELLLNYGSVLFFLLGLLQIWKGRLLRHRLALPFGLYAVGVGAYFLFEINMITSVHDYYLFPFLPGIFVLVALGLRKMATANHRWQQVLAVVLIAALPVTAGLRAYGRWSDKGMPAGLLTHLDALRKATEPNAPIIFANDLSPHISLYHLRRFGWTMDASSMKEEDFEAWVRAGAVYFYCNSRSVEKVDFVSRQLGELVGEWGGVRVWKLNGEPQ